MTVHCRVELRGRETCPLIWDAAWGHRTAEPELCTTGHSLTAHEDEREKQFDTVIGVVSNVDACVTKAVYSHLLARKMFMSKPTENPMFKSQLVSSTQTFLRYQPMPWSTRQCVTSNSERVTQAWKWWVEKMVPLRTPG